MISTSAARMSKIDIGLFRHPNKLPIKSVKVNGRGIKSFDPGSGRVDLTGMRGKLTVEARF